MTRPKDHFALTEPIEKEWSRSRPPVRSMLAA